jgi:hypothetical protein
MNDRRIGPLNFAVLIVIRPSSENLIWVARRSCTKPRPLAEANISANQSPNDVEI